MPGYIGNDPAGSATKIARQTYTTSGAATTDFTFTSGYDVGYLDLYIDGVRQTKGTNFTASDGSTFRVLNGGVGTGSTVEAIAYKTFNLATVDFDDLGNTGNLTLSGDISAVDATFSGDVSIGGTLTYEDVTSIDSVGVITARSDVSIADKIIHTGDTDTAIRFPAADTFTIETAGDEAFRVDSEGRVRLNGAAGVATFSARLQTDGNIHLRPIGDVVGAGFTGVVLDVLNNASSAVRDIAFRGDTTIFRNASAETLRITSAGDMGVGTDSPSQNLHVSAASGTRIQVSHTGGSVDAVLGTDSGNALVGTITNHDFRIITNNGERLRITSGGDVGIGTQAPETPRGNRGLEVAGTTGAEIVATRFDDNITDGDFIGGFVFKNLDAGGTPNHFAGMYAKANGTAGSMDLHFSSDRDRYENDNSDLVIRSGDVGIGTATADNRLHVLTSSTDVVMFESTSAGAGPAITLDHTGASPADDDNIGKIVFNGRNDANQSTTYADIKAISTDVSDGTEDCAFTFSTRTAGSFSEKIRISSGGNLLVNGTSDTAPDGFASLIQVNADNHRGSITIGRHTANANGPALLFQKSRSGSATPGTGVVSDDDTLGIIRFYGSDGTDRNSFAANIACEVDGTPGSNDLPGRLKFSTTADGASSSTERLRITSAGQVRIGSFGSPSNKNTVTPLVHVDGSGVNGGLQVNRHTSVGGGGAQLMLTATRGASITGHTVLQDNDGIGTVEFAGSDGDEFVSAASIQAQVDGTPGNNDMPGRLIFKTTPDGSSTATQAMTIKANHNVEIHDGNIVFETSGDGIDFSADADASGRESELLNDYEHGTFTPTINVEGEANTAIDGVSGTYVKVGKMVYAAFHCVLNGTPSNRTTGNAIQFAGMPFTSLDADSSGADEYMGSVRMHPVDNGSSLGTGSEFMLRLFDNSTGGRIEVRRASNGDLANASLYMTDNQQISASVTYRTAS